MNPLDVIDICCPSTSRSTVQDEVDLPQEHLNPFISSPQQSFNGENDFFQLKEEDSTKEVMKQLTQVREDLKKIKTISSKEKTQINSMLLLLRGEVISMKNSDASPKKRKLILSKFRPVRKSADV